VLKNSSGLLVMLLFAVLNMELIGRKGTDFSCELTCSVIKPKRNTEDIKRNTEFL
jgi:hypothetical protein